MFVDILWKSKLSIKFRVTGGLNTAFQLKNYSDSQIITLGENYQVGKIFMILDKNMVGEVNLTYSNRETGDDPTVAQIQINTKEKK